MKKYTIKMDEAVLKAIEEYRLPRYNEIPDVGLYLNQVAKYINTYTEPFVDMTITESMISNYVKKHLIANPEKKQYNREQICYLMFIGLTKSVLSLENIRRLVDLQLQTYDCTVAYNYFCDEFEKELQSVFGIKERSEENVGGDSEVSAMFHNIIVTVAHKIYLDHCFLAI